MDLDLLAESDSDNESVHGGSVHSVGAYEEGGQGATGRNNTTAMTSSDGSPYYFLFVVHWHSILCFCSSLLSV